MTAYRRLLAIAVMVLGLSACSVSPPKELTPDQRQTIETALTAAHLPLPNSLEIATTGYLVATFEIDIESDAAMARLLEAGVSSPKELASKAIITIRNAALPMKLTESYRVTLNGPSPGPGLIKRYGTARFHENGAVDWEPGSPK